MICLAICHTVCTSCDAIGDDILGAMKASAAASCVLSDVLHRVGGNTTRGLTSSQVEERRNIHGMNEFVIKDEDPLWKKYLKQVCLDYDSLEGMVGII